MFSDECQKQVFCSGYEGEQSDRLRLIENDTQLSISSRKTLAIYKEDVEVGYFRRMLDISGDSDRALKYSSIDLGRGIDTGQPSLLAYQMRSMLPEEQNYFRAQVLRAARREKRAVDRRSREQGASIQASTVPTDQNIIIKQD